MRHLLAATAALSAVFVPWSAQASVPGAHFNGTVSEVFVNNSQILIAVSGTVNGNCRGAWGPYNLTFDIADPGAEVKLALVMEAFRSGRTISGFVDGCGSSNINKLSQVSVY